EHSSPPLPHHRARPAARDRRARGRPVRGGPAGPARGGRGGLPAQARDRRRRAGHLGGGEGGGGDHPHPARRRRRSPAGGHGCGRGPARRRGPAPGGRRQHGLPERAVGGGRAAERRAGLRHRHGRGAAGRRRGRAAGRLPLRAGERQARPGPGAGRRDRAARRGDHHRRRRRRRPGGPGRRRRRADRPRVGQHPAEPALPRDAGRGGQGAGQGQQGQLRGARRPGAGQGRLRRPARRRRRLVASPAAGPAQLQAQGRDAAPRPRRQGHHVRLGGAQPEARRQHVHDEVRHGRRRRGARGHPRHRQAGPAGPGDRLRRAGREPALRHRLPPLRRADDLRRHDGGERQLRRRGPAGDGRRAGPVERGPPGPRRRRRHPDRRLHGGPRRPHRRPDGHRRRDRRPRPGRRRGCGRGLLATADPPRDPRQAGLQGGRPQVDGRRPLRRRPGRGGLPPRVRHRRHPVGPPGHRGPGLPGRQALRLRLGRRYGRRRPHPDRPRPGDEPL
ncbi:MAG: Cytosol aminopeptidase PepA, partial [uncultured Friedmanniella sp.]